MVGLLNRARTPRSVADVPGASVPKSRTPPLCRWQKPWLCAMGKAGHVPSGRNLAQGAHG